MTRRPPVPDRRIWCFEVGQTAFEVEMRARPDDPDRDVPDLILSWRHPDGRPGRCRCADVLEALERAVRIGRPAS